MVGAGLQQFAGDDLLHGQHDAVVTTYANGCAAVLHSLHRIFDLEVAAVRREDGVGEIVSCAY